MATIESREKWNDTGIDLIEGQEYKYEAIGKWKDWFMKPCDANGYSHCCLDLLSCTKRKRSAKWFQLIGVVMDKNTKKPLYTICFSNEGTFTAHASGRLWAYANDAWIAYGNNSGSIELNIPRRK
jgi:hypothetical protein